MITNCNNFNADCVPCDLIGLSTDEKPTHVNNASTFYEMDTRKLFLFDAQNKIWIEQ
jgi:hypothetical protein